MTTTISLSGSVIIYDPYNSGHNIVEDAEASVSISSGMVVITAEDVDSGVKRCVQLNPKDVKNIVKHMKTLSKWGRRK